MAAEEKIIRKNIDVSEATIKTLTIQAIEKGFKTFKEYAQHLLSKEAERVETKKASNK